jgi:predicted esterase
LPDAASYKIYVEPFEWGPAVTRLVLTLPGDVEPGEPTADKFKVTSDTLSFVGPSSSDRAVTGAYVSDASGAQSETASKFVTVLLAYGVEQGIYGGAPLPGSSPFFYDFKGTGHNTWVEANYTVEINGLAINGTKESIVIAKDAYGGRIIPLTDNWIKETVEIDGFTFQTAAYETPEMKQDSGKNPLIIWLHGAGEGGTDVTVALLGNDVTNLSEEGIQKYFKADGLAGAYVLAVQTQTMWMNSGSGQHHGNEDSIYTEALKAAIDGYIEKNGDIDPGRIYLGGCSNGGYMTINMLINYPGFFAAAYPSCQAYMDSFIDEAKLDAIKGTPIWFAQSRDDTTVAPVVFVIPTFIRLLKAGAKDIHLSFFDNIASQDWPGVTYTGHWSWLYPLSDRALLDVDHDYVLENADAILAKGAELIANPGTSAYGPFVGPISADVFPSSSKEVLVNGAPASMWGWMAEIGK